MPEPEPRPHHVSARLCRISASSFVHTCSWQRGKEECAALKSAVQVGTMRPATCGYSIGPWRRKPLDDMLVELQVVGVVRGVDWTARPTLVRVDGLVVHPAWRTRTASSGLLRATAECHFVCSPTMGEGVGSSHWPFWQDKEDLGSSREGFGGASRRRGWEVEILDIDTHIHLLLTASVQADYKWGLHVAAHSQHPPCSDRRMKRVSSGCEH